MKNHVCSFRALLVVALLTALFALPSIAHAQNPAISWGTPTASSGDSDVVTTGAFVAAFNFGAAGVAATTVNGVTFAPFAVNNDFTTGRDSWQL